MQEHQMQIAFPGGDRITADFHGNQIETGDENQPSAFDFFLIGLATCSASKVLHFCRERDIPTDAIRMRQRMYYNPDTRMFESIVTEIQLPPDFPAKYRDAVVRAAESCGVRRHLLNPPAMETIIVPGEPEA